MENREMISECLYEIQQKYKLLEELIDSKSDQQLDGILEVYFKEYVTNINTNFNFLQMIISRVNEDEYLETGRKSMMSNEDLEEYFKENWDLLIGDYG